ncbi:endonuclease Q family protein [Runella salmonicolor]|uniref:Endonuclease Q family protein n=1 Tax=Runella salmonicolor TaxID=2950278 RepID=A0ABT1FLF8_9BACT|nr:endonuclease Q family protein [Runella salmonicolor]MCP1382591.1 endonuclease Q family protein [Runella salmonicolor]
MSTAQILYKQYKALPKRLQNELKQLINAEEEELVEINLPEFKKAVKQVKLLREGKIQARPVSELIKELENGL